MRSKSRAVQRPPVLAKKPFFLAQELGREWTRGSRWAHKPDPVSNELDRSRA